MNKLYKPWRPKFDKLIVVERGHVAAARAAEKSKKSGCKAHAKAILPSFGVRRQTRVGWGGHPAFV
jgi:hypothetical protein